MGMDFISVYDTSSTWPFVEIGQYDLNILENNFHDRIKLFQLDFITTEKLNSIFDDIENNKLKYYVIRYLSKR